MLSKLTLLLLLVFSLPMLAQEIPAPHRFLDRPARFSLATSAALYSADAATLCHYSPTRFDDMTLPVHSCRGIALWMAGSFAAQTSAALYLHRTGHHRLERFVEMFSASGSAIGIGFTLASRPHAASAEPIQVVPVHTNPSFCIVGQTC